MKRFINYILHDSSVETDMIVGLLLTLSGFVLAIVLSFKTSGSFLFIIGIVLLVLGLLMYGRALYKAFR